MTEQDKITTFLKHIPRRIGTKPVTIGPAPHTQTNQFPDNDAFASLLDEYIMSFDGVVNGESHIGDGGLRAYFVKSDNTKGFSPNFLIDNEFAHIHRHGSKSLHIVLPPELGKEMEMKGWTENHPLAVANRIPTTNFMLFGARSQEELEISKALVRVSYLFATNQWL